jgi:hypothetical protein
MSWLETRGKHSPKITLYCVVCSQELFHCILFITAERSRHGTKSRDMKELWLHRNMRKFLMKQMTFQNNPQIPPRQASQGEPKQGRLMGQMNRDVHAHTPHERSDENPHLHPKGCPSGDNRQTSQTRVSITSMVTHVPKTE